MQPALALTGASGFLGGVIWWRNACGASSSRYLCRRAIVGRSRTSSVHCSTAVIVGLKARGVITEATPPEPRPGSQATNLEIESIIRAELPHSEPLATLLPREIVGPGGSSVRQMIGRIESKRRFEND